MSFLSPLAFAAFALSLPLVLLYFLKVRRRERRISSLLLWDAALRDREASTFFQRLQRDPLLVLQILALLALTLALARPIVTVMGAGARKVVVVLDVSASMKARDVSPSRFDICARLPPSRMWTNCITITSSRSGSPPSTSNAALIRAR